MYQQSLIEKHNTILRSISLDNLFRNKTITPETIPSIENLQPILQNEQPKVERNENNEKKTISNFHFITYDKVRFHGNDE